MIREREEIIRTNREIKERSKAERKKEYNGVRRKNRQQQLAWHL